MPYDAKIILDSLAPNGKRLTTMQLTYPRFIHSELMTHRMLSKNSASSRAIPVQKMITRVMDDPVEPVWFGKNQPGMQADEELNPSEKMHFLNEWHSARQQAITHANRMVRIGAHKQIVNRILEPWMWMTVIISGTEWSNLFHLRTDRLAQPEFKKIADMACELYFFTLPKEVDTGDWHLPFMREEDWSEIKEMMPFGDPMGPIKIARDVSTARCARVSYLTHDGIRSIDEDLNLFKKLQSSGHWSPFEHVACAQREHIRSGNFIGWAQYRKYFSDENKETFDLKSWSLQRDSTSV